MFKGTKTNGKKNVVKGIVIAALSLGVVGAAFAYFTAQAQQKDNRFNIRTSEGDIIIEEPDWDPEDPEHNDLTPNQYVKKNPFTLSTMDYDGYIIMRVSVPKIQATLHGEGDGKWEIADLCFSKDANNNIVKSFDDANFEKLAEYDEENEVVRYYGYKKVVKSVKNSNPAATKTGERGSIEDAGKDNSTVELFKEFRIKNFDKVSAEVSATKYEIDVDAKIIQKVDPATGKDFEATGDKSAVRKAFETLTDNTLKFAPNPASASTNN